MFDREEVLKQADWADCLAEDLFILNKTVFPNESQEAKIIWMEILENIINHMDNMVKSPAKWTVENRFWLNSKYMCTRLGLGNFKDRKLDIACFLEKQF